MASAVSVYSLAGQRTFVHHLEMLLAGCIYVMAVGLIFCWMERRHTQIVPVQAQVPALKQILGEAAIVSAAIVLALLIAQALGFTKPYWAAVSCVAILQGPSIRAAWTRHLHKTLGTLTGVLLCFVFLEWFEEAFLLAFGIGSLTFMVTVYTSRHYAIGNVFITPLAILMAEAHHPSPMSVKVLVVERLAETILGATIGLAFAYAVHRRVGLENSEAQRLSSE